MNTKTIKNGEETVTFRVIRENILGLIIDDSITDTIGEAFGWTDQDYDTVLHALLSFFKFQEAAEELDDLLPKSTKISTLADFLNSSAFKKLHIKIETPNDYFMLGFIYNAALFFKLRSARNIMGGDLLSSLLSGLAEKKEKS